MKFVSTIPDETWKWKWHIWFAWFPVLFIHKNKWYIVFLEKVYRRKTQQEPRGGAYMEYAPNGTPVKDLY